MTEFEKISSLLCLGEILFAAYNSLIASYCTYAWTILPSDVSNSDIANIFKAVVFIKWVLVLSSVFNLVQIHRYWGQQMVGNRWNTFLPWNRFPTLLTQVFGIIIGFVFVVNFTPLRDDNCGIYSESTYVCLAMQLIALDTYFALAVIIFSNIIKYCCLTNISFMDRIRRITQRQINVNINNDYLDSLHKKQFRILSKSTNNEECAICRDDEKIGKWKVLSCGHEFHVLCIDEWSVGHNTCPTCRHPIVGDDESVMV